jgi:ferredoxin-NADP reductase
MNYISKLLNREVIAEGTMAFHFEKPEGFEFQPGQFCFIVLPDIGFKDERGLRRHLSIASSPLEKELMFATKISESAFKKTLKEMPIGVDVTIEKPLGSFTLMEDTAMPVAFLAAGIGITPFLSMVRYAAGVPSKQNITLFYSNRTPEEAAFLDEFLSIAELHKNIVLVATMTRVSETSKTSDWLTGRISPSMIINGCSEWRDAVYYIAGPPGMVDGMREMLEGMNIVSDRIKTERFTGY